MEVFLLDRIPLCLSEGKTVTAGTYRMRNPGYQRKWWGVVEGGGRHEAKTSCQGPSAA